ncbi:fimbrial protein [Enterobacter quasiroggenkampii]|uniref:Fimbrial protein n=1 Tax=Enterobacter quasiroggenkampii TaxID=2497436 RepID=A0ABY8DZ92_9ENTR|nr:fimbrial protein [Enterobacter quasiroggenkampii]MBG0625894.1 fimbrial protein [Enterobacter roggenkampii]MEB6577421.1 fimbrial protein [Enterobacter quasiroggenkampii]WFC82104.1 fimbrial protein [Enterobacter quasiroggenkampii]
MKIVYFFPLAMLFSGMPITYADDGASINLQIFGTIIGESCDVDVNSKEQTVDLGDFDASEFPVPGTTSPEKAFTIDLNNCSRAIQGTKVWFSGTPDSNNPDLLALSDTGKGTATEMATGVGVELLNAELNPIKINNVESAIYPLKQGDNSLTFNLRYKSTLPAVTPGNATAIMYFDLLYQ